MTPGRELDALIAEKVMGFKVESQEEHAWGIRPLQKVIVHYIKDCGELPAYSTDISAAWEVLERINSINSNLVMIPSTNTIGEDGEMDPHDYGYNWFVDGITMPHAICLAALKVLDIQT